MSNLLNSEGISAGKATPPAAPAYREPEPVDFEIVLGRAQIASTSLVAIVFLALLSAFSYLIGKSMVPTVQASSTPAPAVVKAQGPVQEAPVAPAVAPIAAPAPVAAQAVAPIVQPAASPVTAFSSPIFGEEAKGKVYLQAGVIDKGLAGIWAEGLRAHGLEGFVAPGPNPTLWRVLIGPLPDSQSYDKAKHTLDVLGVNTFGRRFEE